MTTKAQAPCKASLFGQLLAAFLSILIVAQPILAQEPPPIEANITLEPLTVSTYTQIVPNTQVPINLSLGSDSLGTITPKPVPVALAVSAVGAAIGENGACTAPIPSTAIIQDCGLGHTSFESNMINLWLGIHGMPESEASVIYQYGGLELRSELRSFMFAYLRGVILEDASKRSPSDQALYNWLQSAVKDNEIAYYDKAVKEYQKWFVNPCSFQLDQTVADTFGISYNGQAYCIASRLPQATPLPGPTASYFKELGQIAGYDSKVTKYDGKITNSAVTGAKIMLEAQRDTDKWVALGGLGVSLAIGGTVGAAVGANILSIAPFIFRVTQEGASIAETAVIGITSGVADVLGAAGIVLIFAQIGAEALVDLLDTVNNQKEIDAMVAYGKTVANQTPDLAAMLHDAVGFQKIFETFIAATLPDVQSQVPPALPALPSPTDFSSYGFYFEDHTNNVVGVNNSFNYTTWDPKYPDYPGNEPYPKYGTSFNVSSFGTGWFIQTEFQGAASHSFLSPTIRYIDPNTGIHYTADRIDKGRFLVSKAPDAVGDNDIDCPVKPITGVSQSTANIPTLCKSFVVNSLNIYAFDYANQTVRMPQPPVFATPNAAAFSIGQGSLVFYPKLDSTSAGLPCTIRTSGTLPPGFAFSNGALYLQQIFAAAPGSYQFDFVANCETLTNGNQSNYSFGTAITTQTFTATVYGTPTTVFAPAANRINARFAAAAAIPDAAEANDPSGLQFVYPASDTHLTFTQGRSTTLLVQTNGGPGTTIAAGANALPPGMTLADNGNGTATVSGIPTGAAPSCSSDCAITASAPGLTSATLILNDTVALPQLPTIPASQNIAWTAEQNNIAAIDGSAAANGTPTQVPLSWSVVGTLPSWASLTDNGNNIANISGTPPVSATGQTIPIQFHYSYGGNPGFTSQAFTLNIAVNPPAPVLSVSPVLLFQVGVAGSGTINSSTLSGAAGLGGTWQVNAALPEGLTATSGTTSLVIAGTPVSHGNFLIPIQFTDTTGQSFTRNVSMMIDQPASLANFPARLVLFEGVPANVILPVTAGFPRNPAGTPGDGLPSTSGTGIALTGAYPTTNGFTVTSTGGGLIFKGTPLAPASYPLTVSAQTVLSTGPVGDKVSQPFTLYVQPAGDMNLDGAVDCADYNLIKAHFGAVIGQANYLDSADANRDGVVNILDLAFVQAHLPKGTVCR
jgi:hypothetical protein